MTTKKRKIVSTVTAATTAAALILTGTFAWQSISQTALNEKVVEVNPGGRLHDDFDGTNKDVYVENFGDSPIFARIRLDEYMEIGTGAGLKTGDEGYEDKNVTKVAEGLDINQPENWKTHIPGDDTDKFHQYIEWELGGSTVYMPTFNKNKDSLKADINGTYQGTVPGDDTHYDDYHAYTLGESKTDNAVYDADDNTVDEGDGAVEGTHIKTKEETHQAANTLDGTVMTMKEWVDAGSKPGAYWVYDEDGWAYWAQAIQPNTATGLLLTGISQISDPGDTWYYGINVVGQFATIGEWDGFEGTPSDNALFLLNQASGRKLNVKIAGGASEVKLGANTTFTAEVLTGEARHPNQKVAWSVTGAKSVNTKITGDGKLTVGADEYVGGTLKVQALSNVDNTTFATYDVKVLSTWDTTGIGNMATGTLETVMFDGRDWYLLARDGNKALLWTKELETTFGTNGKGKFGASNQWEGSEIRTWLNGTYADTLTTLGSHLVETAITTRSQYNATDWITTQDKVFLLSEADLFGTFNKEATSEAKDYTYGNTQLVTDVNMRKFSSTVASYCWLRTPRGDANGVALVYDYGAPGNDYYSNARSGVRPALWVDLGQ